MNILMYLYTKFIKTPVKLILNKKKKNRKLDIGPGAERIFDFETINIVWNEGLDYIGDVTKKLPFKTETFDIIHASHVLEHIAWYELNNTLTEWVRVLKRGAVIEIWVPDGYKLAKLLCDIEDGCLRKEWIDGWRPHNTENDPYKWINGRILYGVRKDYPSWHNAIITFNYLQRLLSDLGLVEITRMESHEVRGMNHGWINLGIKARKKI